MFNSNTGGKNTPNTIISLIILVMMVVGFFILARFVFKILAILAPFLLIAALIMDYRVVLGYGRWLVDLVRRNPVLGVAAVILSFVAFPLVAAFLAAKAVLGRNVRQAQQAHERRLKDEYVDFEIVDDLPLELPELTPSKPKEKAPARREEQAPPPPPPPSPSKEDPRKKREDEGEGYDQLFD